MGGKLIRIDASAAHPRRVRRDKGAPGDGALGGGRQEEDRPRDRRVRPGAQGERTAEPEGVHHRDQVEVRRRPGGKAGERSRSTASPVYMYVSVGAPFSIFLYLRLFGSK